MIYHNSYIFTLYIIDIYTLQSYVFSLIIYIPCIMCVWVCVRCLLNLASTVHEWLQKGTQGFSSVCPYPTCHSKTGWSQALVSGLHVRLVFAEDESIGQGHSFAIWSSPDHPRQRVSCQKAKDTLPENKWTQQNHPATAAFLSMSTLKFAWVVLQVKAELKRMTSYIWRC